MEQLVKNSYFKMDHQLEQSDSEDNWDECVSSQEPEASGRYRSDDPDSDPVDTEPQDIAIQDRRDEPDETRDEPIVNTEPEVEILKTNKGKPMLVNGGYCYHLNKTVMLL